MIEQLGETEDRWDKVADTAKTNEGVITPSLAKTHDPDDPKDGS